MMHDVNIKCELNNAQTEMLGLLKNLVETESPSRDIEGISRCAEIVADALNDFDLSISRISTSMGPIVKFSVLPGKTVHSKQVLVLCHMDTVYPKETTKVFPFKATGDELWGPGVFDMKSGLVQSVFALRYLARNKQKLEVPVTLLCTPDEEIGSVASKQVILDEATSSSCVFIPEPSLGEAGALKTSRSGRAQYYLRIKGISSHSGLDPLVGASAIKELASQILAIYKIARANEGLYINVGLVRGGTAVNVIPEFAEAEIDVRLTRRSQMEYVNESFSTLQPTDPRITMTVEGALDRPPWEGEPDGGHLFKLAKEIGSNMGFELTSKHAGGGSDGNFTAALGIPTLDGLGPIGSGAHSLGKERILFSSMVERTALLYELIYASARGQS